MSGRGNGLRPYSYTIPAGTEVQVQLVGDFLRVHESTAPVVIYLESSAVGVEMPMGDQMKIGGGYARLRIYSETTQTITMLMGFGEYDDNSEDINVNTTANVTPGNALANIGDIVIAAVSGSVLRAADASGLTVIIKASSSNTEAVRVGAAGVGAANGYPLEPGESLSLSTTSAINAYNPAGTSQKVHVLPVRLI